MRTLQTRRTASPFFIDNFFEDFEQLLANAGSPLAVGRRAESAFLPPYELSEDERGYVLSFDVPGIPKENIQIELKDNQLRIWGERKFDEEKTEGKRHYSERRYGKFERTFSLPNEVDADKIQAHHEDGVLHLMLPKAARVQSKSIKIESGTGGFLSKLVGKKDEGKVQ